MKVAAVQAEPAWFDLDGGVDKVIALAKEASSNGAQLIGLPEAFIPGYPMRTWSGAFDPVFFTKYLKSCLSVKSPQYQKLLKGIKQANIWAVVGFVERDGESMYCAQSIINPSGEVVLHRRKLKATGHERTFWGDGPADSLKTSVKGPEGAIIGCFNCWEHLQPLLRFHHYAQGVQIHVASWPFADPVATGYPPQLTGYPSQFSSDFQVTATKYMAMEGPLFVISSTQVIKPENAALCGTQGTPFDAKVRVRKAIRLASDIRTHHIYPQQQEGGGFAAIYGPDGRDLVQTLPAMEEGILYADIDLDDLLTAKLMVDPVGHYSRPDLLSLHINTPINPLVRQQGKKEEEYSLLSKIPQLVDD